MSNSLSSLFGGGSANPMSMQNQQGQMQGQEQDPKQHLLKDISNLQPEQIVSTLQLITQILTPEQAMQIISAIENHKGMQQPMSNQNPNEAQSY